MFTMSLFLQVGIPNSRLRYFLIAKISTDDMNTQTSSKVRLKKVCRSIRKGSNMGHILGFSQPNAHKRTQVHQEPILDTTELV